MPHEAGPNPVRNWKRVIAELEEQAEGQAEDALLIERVARQRDREAFSRLFERHKTAAYNLARYLSNNADEAEEAVQDGMLRAWSAAASYRMKGSVRGWLLKIVVRECLRIRRERHSQRNRMARKQELEAQADPPSAALETERREELGALRAGLMRLDEGSRHLLTLYFGAGMSQEEVGDALGMPQTTVSRKLQDILKDLRGHLANAGFASAVPLVNVQRLEQLLCGWEEAPSSLGLKLLTRLGEECERASRRIAPAKVASTGLAAWTVIAVVAAGTGVWVAVNSGTPEPAAATAVEGASEVAASSPAASGPVLYDDHFTSAELDAFWTVAPRKQLWLRHPAPGMQNQVLLQPQGVARTAQGDKRSNLVLEAWGRGWLAQADEVLDGITPEAVRDRKVFDAQPAMAEIVSQACGMNGKPLFVEMDSVSPEGEGRFEYGVEFQHEDGQVLIRQGYRVERRSRAYWVEDFLMLNGKPAKTDFRPRLLTVLEPLGIAGAIAHAADADAYAAPDLQSFTSIRALTTNLSNIRLRIYVKAEAGGYVRWPIDRLQLGREPLIAETFSKRWSFETEPHADWPDVPGTWEWKAPNGKLPGRMLANMSGDSKLAAFKVPFKVPARPFCFKARVMLPSIDGQQSKAGIDGAWLGPQGPQKHLIWQNKFYVTADKWLDLEIYFFRRYVITRVDGKVFSLREFQTQYPTREAFLGFRGLAFHWVDLSTMQEDELPKEVRGAEGLAAQMDAGPQESKTGEMQSLLKQPQKPEKSGE